MYFLAYFWLNQWGSMKTRGLRGTREGGWTSLLTPRQIEHCPYALRPSACPSLGHPYEWQRVSSQFLCSHTSWRLKFIVFFDIIVLSKTCFYYIIFIITLALYLCLELSCLLLCYWCLFLFASIICFINEFTYLLTCLLNHFGLVLSSDDIRFKIAK